MQLKQAERIGGRTAMRVRGSVPYVAWLAIDKVEGAQIGKRG